VCGRLYPGVFKPTPAHYFVKLLHTKGLLLRCFTQNIDSLESAAGLPSEAIVAAHGNFDGAHCIECNARADPDTVRLASKKEYNEMMDASAYVGYRRQIGI
jgi:NAD-dependent SIR2 family protein deacetylase